MTKQDFAKLYCKFKINGDKNCYDSKYHLSTYSIADDMTFVDIIYTIESDFNNSLPDTLTPSDILNLLDSLDDSEKHFNNILDTFKVLVVLIIIEGNKTSLTKDTLHSNLSQYSVSDFDGVIFYNLLDFTITEVVGLPLLVDLNIE